MRKNIKASNPVDENEEENGSRYKLPENLENEFKTRLDNIINKDLKNLEENLGEIFEADFMYIRANIIESVERAKDMLSQFGPFEINGNPKMLESYAKLVDTIVNASKEQINLYMVLKGLAKDTSKKGQDANTTTLSFADKVKQAKSVTDKEGN